MKDNRTRTEEFLRMFRDPVFAILDEKKVNPVRHTTDLTEVLTANEDGRSGAYFSVNGFANFTQRKAELATSFNGHFIDIDSADKPTQDIKNEIALIAAEKGIPFTCLVTTGRGVHGYWIFKEPIVNPTEQQKVEYLRVQALLVRAFGADEAVKDIARIMRIPLGKYWKDGSGKEIELGTITENRYDESDLSELFPPAMTSEQKSFTPMKEVAHADHGDRHRKSFLLALKISNQFSHSRDEAYAVYRAVVDRYYEIVARDKFHEPGGEADTQFESAWERVRTNPYRTHDEATEMPEERAFKPAVSLNDLMKQKFEAPQWAVEQLFESGTMNMISARPNHYKSWVMLEIAIAMAKGSMLFERFKTSKQSVMIVNEEDGARMIQDRMRQLSPGVDDMPIYFHAQQGLKLEDHDVKMLLEEAKSKGVTTIIFDSLRSVHGKDENSSKDMQDVMDQLKKFTRAGITILFTHHNRKKPPFGSAREDGEESRGSSGINAAVHGHISLDARKENGQRYIIIRQQKLKAAEKIGAFEVIIRPIPFGFVYHREHADSEGPQGGTNDKVADALGAENSWFSVNDLVSAGCGGLSSIRQAVRTLQGRKVVEAKLRKDVVNQGLPTKSKDGAPNQILYHLIPDEEWAGEFQAE